MALTAFDRVPLVDIGPLLDPAADPAALADTVAALGRAAREVGFVYVGGCAPAPGVFERMLAATKAFFALERDEKMRTYIGLSSSHKGYVPEGEEVFAGGTPDRKEAFDLALDLPADDPDVAGCPLLGPVTWPDVPGFRADVTAYYDHTLTVGRALFRGFATALGEAPGFFDPYLTKPPSQLRLLHYPYDPDAEDRPGIGAHTDYECFTLLRPTEPGLEVLNGDGTWIDAPMVGGADYVVNIGDMLELWSNGEFVATTHRVRKVSVERYSFPLFCSVDYPTVVGPLPRFVTPERPPVSGPVVAGEHLFAQTAQTFTYLKDRVASGELVLPGGALALASFGRAEATAGGTLGA
jgi:isopenicillin N synthase-like dioxygenase